MRIFKLLLLLFFVGVFSGLKAQDIHYTQYYLSPLTLNPALTGGFEGTFRIGGIYRDQWRSVLNSNAFQTPSVYIDAPIITGFRKQDWVGIGLNVLNDQVGSVGYSNTNAGLAAAYHFAIGPKKNPGRTVLSIGAQAARTQKRFDQTLLRFESQWDGQTLNGSQDAGEGNFSENTNFLGINSGLSLSTALNKDETTRLNLGVGVFNINGPQDGFKQTDQLGAKIVAHANVDFDLNDKWTVTPHIFFQTLDGAQEINIAAIAGYKLRDDLVLQFGESYRIGDAINTIVGLQYNSLRVGVSYDVNISKLQASTGNRGGLEFGVGYIFSIFSDPNVKPVIFCPGF